MAPARGARRSLRLALALVAMAFPILYLVGSRETAGEGPGKPVLEVPRDGFEFDPELTGRGEKMNYGPFLAFSLISAGRERDVKTKPGKVLPGPREEKVPPIVLRAINVHLGGKHGAAFDTELCGFVAAWSGGFLDVSRTNLNGYKGTDLAYLRLPALFQNSLLPGWSLDGRFADPRPTPSGALPKPVAHFKGLYLHAWKTVLSYTVGTSNVLDLPTMLVKDKTEVFCRTIRIDRADKPRYLFVCDLPGATGTIDRGTMPPVARLERREATIQVGLAGLPGAELQVRDRNRVVVKLPAHGAPKTFKVFVARGGANLRDAMKQAEHVEDLPALCKGGPARWKQEIVVRGKLGPNDRAYAVDTIPLPDGNPWGSWMRPGALDFFPDGRAALCTWSGDVWIASGLDGKLEKVRWKRFATGLFEPLGLKVVGGKVHVLGRDQITRLHDLNSDGEADFYENFNNDAPTAPTFHGFAFELHTDRAGNFYCARGAHRVPFGTPMHGGVIKVARDGSRAELLCSGLREPNGMSVGPDDTITVADNQGNWVPSSKIDLVKRGAFYGHVWGPKDEGRTPEPPLCWLPMSEDNSSGGQVWVTSDKWGPFKGHLLHTSYGTGKLFKVFVQRDGARFQGGAIAFPLAFDTGIMRARFHPKDGQLYACGLRGWGTKAPRDGGLYRVRYTGKPVHLPLEVKVARGTVSLAFPVALRREGLTPALFDVQRWNYRRTKAYGSKDYSVADPKKVGRDRVKVQAVSLSADGKTVTLEIADLKPVMQMAIGYKGLTAEDGAKMADTVYQTINYVP